MQLLSSQFVEQLIVPACGLSFLQTMATLHVAAVLCRLPISSDPLINELRLLPCEHLVKVHFYRQPYAI